MSGCKKFLEKKPDKSLAIPISVNDLQALLDDNSHINQYVNNGIGEASADNYYITSADWNALYSEGDKSVYIWGDELFYSQFPNDWSSLYSVIYRTDLVLEKLISIERDTVNAVSWDNVKGSACFLRAAAFHVLATLFTNAYDSTSADVDLGIPLRLNTDFNQVSVRSSNQETYARIIQDLLTAIPLLPVHPSSLMRPSKPAAYALLSRVYLSMRAYTEAGRYADSCLQLSSSLLDYNSLNPSASLPFSQFNTETLFYAHGAQNLTGVGKGKIDSVLYQSYSSNDLRKTLFFVSNGNGTFGFKGHYTGIASVMFVGIATDEMYLTRAECKARQGNTISAMDDLNTLLVTRWKIGSFIPFTASGSDIALDLILKERRKELVMRDLRWMDIKRMNKEGAGIKLKRYINNQQYTLLPNESKFALPLPAYVLSLTGMQQNPR